MGSGPTNARVGGTGYWKSSEEIETIVYKWKWPEENSRKEFVESRQYEIFSWSGKKWRQVYDIKKDMRVLYNGWERWITSMRSDKKIGDGSKKSFKTVMGTWQEDSSQTSKMGEKQDDEETWGLEGRYSSDGGHYRHSLDYHSDKLRENLLVESE